MGGADAFVAGYAVAAALLALWLDVRLGARRPESLRRRAAHLVAAFVAMQVGSFAFVRFATDASPTLQSVALGAYLLCFVYVFLAALWLLRAMTELGRSYG